jgi:uncharacterized membrane protein
MAEIASPRSMYVATIGILSALMAVLAYASIVVPTPLGSLDASSVLIFGVAVLYGPELGLIITVVGQLVGKGLLITYAGLPAVYIPGVVAVRGIEAYVVGYLGRRFSSSRYGEPSAMVTGVIWETTGFVLADLFLYGMIGGVFAGIVAVLTGSIWTIIDLIWVPLGLAAVYYTRAAFKARYLDEHLNLVNAPGHRGIFFFCLFITLLSWALIVFAGLTGLLWGPVLP